MSGVLLRRTILIDTGKVQFIPREHWYQYEVYNDNHGGLLATVTITDEYAKQIEAVADETLSVNLAVILLWTRQVLHSG